MVEGYTQDYKTYGQYLRKVPANWWVKWEGVNGRQHDNRFISKPDAYQHYRDVTRAGFKATTNAEPTKRVKGGLTKAKKHAIERVKQEAGYILVAAEIELKRSSQQRRKALEKAHSFMSTNCYNLDIQPPRLGTYYDPQEYLDHATAMLEAVKKLEDQYTQGDKQQ